MADKERKIVPPKVPRPNYQMWLILALTAVILSITLFNRNRGLVEITDTRFEDMIGSNDVKTLTLVKRDEVVQITLRNEALQNAPFYARSRRYWVFESFPVNRMCFVVHRFNGQYLIISCYLWKAFDLYAIVFMIPKQTHTQTHTHKNIF